MMTIKIKIENTEIEQVSEFVYLGSLLTEDRKCKMDIMRCTGLAAAMFGKFNRLWRAKNISQTTKIRL